MLRRRPTTVPLMFSAACAASSLVLSGCDRDAASQRGTSSESAAVSSESANAESELFDTYQKLRELYLQGAYGSLRPYIDPEYCEDVIDLLVVVDELLSANRAA